MRLRLKIPPLTLIEIDYPGIGKQAHPFRAHLVQGLKDINHHLFAQAIALIPGASRAASTIIGGMVFGLSRTAATEFSFFLAIPVMFAATAYDLYKSRNLLATDDVMIFLIGFITAFIAALFVIKVLIRYVASHDFKLFAWYRIGFGALVLFYYW